ncbi:hypothetical protein KCP69_13435 [Salmonella enterica subsp. enterica]|nr:hypothetical protein KCP69_13435 [Salmonella enterica subsp. enterica]
MVTSTGHEPMVCDYFGVANLTVIVSSKRRRGVGCLYFIRKHSAIIRKQPGILSREDPYLPVRTATRSPATV